MLSMDEEYSHRMASRQRDGTALRGWHRGVLDSTSQLCNARDLTGAESGDGRRGLAAAAGP